ncbi:hypothetical protein CERSUDRAFT_109896 [Gelatoporia subvermispora B]|uniref:B30.2/SPRY domain-containing protein n=1 Tax=Ceriporiopsis subvermispora (strain B) TaxID=914234 RepID=M2QW23_CERS8|nr:hypothetical protein CERSUDRAFT_109896 [Gelatoporia subvermispora B]
MAQEHTDPFADPVMHLPTRWSDQDRHPLLVISADGRELTFNVPAARTAGEKDSGAARADRPIPLECGIYYYEVEILHRGQKGHIGVGFCTGDTLLTRLPGWEEQSWAYHADDGYAFEGQKDGVPYRPTFNTGYVIGCGIDFLQNRAFYTKNGAFIDVAFEGVMPPTSTPGLPLELFPVVGMRHNDEKIRANFGDAPFRYAIAEYIHGQRGSADTD